MRLVYNLNKISAIPELPGVYQYRDRQKKIIYVGKAISLRKRVSSYFKNNKLDQKTRLLVQNVNEIVIIPVDNEFEALLLEASLIKKYQPKYNIVAKDDRHYIYISVSREIFPRIILTRGEGNYGPFPSTKIARDILGLVRSIVPYCTQGSKIKRPCLYSHLGLCFPCPAFIRKQSENEYDKLRSLYLKNIRQIKFMLHGRLHKIKSILEREMTQFSKNENFEEAAKLRDRLNNLEYLVSNYHVPALYMSNPNLLAQKYKTEHIELADILNKYYTQLNLLKRIECYDISNLQGKRAVGSMVTFIEGLPEKKLYRKFRIRETNRPNDFAMLREIFSRRLKHSEWSYPDLIIVDGGIPQLSVMEKVIEEFNLSIPIIGLAKRLEEIVVKSRNEYHKLKLPDNSSALHLLQRLRDEAHRFAHQYHEFLSSKELLRDRP